MKARVIASVLTIILLTTATVLFSSTTQTYAERENCDPSYPDVCIPRPPPDLDCGDIADKDFTVLPPDPHGFDLEGDGTGCES
jgi:micrococcal nuclease